ncbi:MAG TPA: serine kinase [Rhodanobacteraceae bacterium]|nr:serine kinase [Rhodanobacteraceae bacterium]
MTVAASFRSGLQGAMADPFRERERLRFRVHKHVLGARFLFESDDAALLYPVEAAYDGLPRHRLPLPAREFNVQLRLVPHRAATRLPEPPPVRTQSGAGLLCGVMDECNYVVVAPAQHRALVVASEDMLERPYHLRYELIEFAVFTLAARAQGLVPLHGACIGRNGCGILLLGASGSGKSTLALLAVLRGLDLLSEDAVFVQPERLLATGVANYLHVQAEALQFTDDDDTRRWINRAPVIRRRSGATKFEVDPRRGPASLAETPLELAAAVFLRDETVADSAALLTPVAAADIGERLRAGQPYAATQPGWDRFAAGMAQRGAFELRRGRHPHASIDALLPLLG